MPNIATTLKSEIARVARKEIKADLDALRKTTTQYRAEIASLKRRLEPLERQLKKVGKVAAKAALTESPEEDTTKLRFRADGFATLRKKLGLSAQAMGKLLDVSGQSVYKWETGKAHPRAKQLQAISAIRSLGKREALARLGG